MSDIKLSRLIDSMEITIITDKERQKQLPTDDIQKIVRDSFLDFVENHLDIKGCRVCVQHKEFVEKKMNSRWEVIKAAFLLLFFSIRYRHFTLSLFGLCKGPRRPIRTRGRQ